jgi:hypothetical protein
MDGWTVALAISVAADRAFRIGTSQANSTASEPHRQKTNGTSRRDQCAVMVNEVHQPRRSGLLERVTHRHTAST